LGKSPHLIRALLYLAIILISNEGAARYESQNLNVLKRTEDGRPQNGWKT